MLSIWVENVLRWLIHSHVEVMLPSGEIVPATLVRNNKTGRVIPLVSVSPAPGKTDPAQLSLISLSRKSSAGRGELQGGEGRQDVKIQIIVLEDLAEGGISK